MSNAQPRHEVVISYCEPCGERARVLDLAREVLEQWENELRDLTLRPSASPPLTVTLDGDVVFDGDRDAGAVDETAEIVARLEGRLGPPPGFGA